MSDNALMTDTKGGSNTYLSIINGKLAQKVKEGTPGAKARENKNGETVHELLFTGIKGKISNISLTEEKFGYELHITIINGGQKYVIQIPASGGYAFGFLSRVPNIDYLKEAELRPFAIKEGDKTKNFFVVYQDGKKVEPFFTKDAPNGLPALELKKVRGKDAWDDTARIEFFTELLYNEVVPKLAEMYGQGAAAEKHEEEQEPDFQNEPSDEILNDLENSSEINKTAKAKAAKGAKK